MSLSDDEYRRLLEFRTGLRRFLQWSATVASEAGLSPAQHQLLLAVRGRCDPRGPRIGELADELLLRQHSVVELVDRAEAAGFVRRVGDPADARYVRVQLTDHGAACLETLSRAHLEELGRLGSRLQDLWAGLGIPEAAVGQPAD